MSQGIVNAALQAMSTNPAVQTAIVDYFKAEARKAEGGEWVEVWRQKSEETTPLTLMDPYSGVTKPRDAYLLVVAKYCKTENVGVIRGRIVVGDMPAREYDNDPRRDTPETLVSEVAITSADYTDTIKAAQNTWENALQAFYYQVAKLNREDIERQQETERAKDELRAKLGIR